MAKKPKSKDGDAGQEDGKGDPKNKKGEQEEDNEEEEDEEEDDDRDKSGKFKKKIPKKKSTSKKVSSTDSTLLEEISVDLEKEVELKFGKIDLKHLDTESKIITMRSMLKGKGEKEKKELSGTDNEDADTEWEPPKSFLALSEENDVTKQFYDSKKAFGNDIFSKIHTKK